MCKYCLVMEEEEQVVLVNESDEFLGLMPKLEVHKKGVLHRAFSIFIFNDKGEMMLQQRAQVKYHSPGLWTNACCSHQRYKESTIDAAHRRLMEEMGFDTSLEYKGSFIYKAHFPNGLIEHEFDHVLIGRYNHIPILNPDEASNWRWISLDQLREDLENIPEDFTPWFRIIFEKFEDLIDL